MSNKMAGNESAALPLAGSKSAVLLLYEFPMLKVGRINAPPQNATLPGGNGGISENRTRDYRATTCYYNHLTITPNGSRGKNRTFICRATTYRLNLLDYYGRKNAVIPHYRPRNSNRWGIPSKELVVK